MMTSGVDNIQRDAVGDAGGVMSPYEVDRNWSLAADDTRHTSCRRRSCATSPSGREGSTWTRAASPTRSSAAGSSPRSSATRPAFHSTSGPASATSLASSGRCIPSSGGNVFAQDKGSFDPNKGPLFDVNAFTPTDAFNFNYGQRTTHQRHPRLRLQEPGPLLHQEHEAVEGHQPAAPGRGLQRLELAQLHQRREHRQPLGFQHRHRRR